MAQKVHFEYLTVKEGLPQSTIGSIIKDKYGFMWFGTFNGLCRYDGYHIKVYRTIPGDTTSIGNSRIHHIYKDSAGNLWITSFNSYYSRYNYETDNFTRFTTNRLPPNCSRFQQTGEQPAYPAKSLGFTAGVYWSLPSVANKRAFCI